LLKLEYIYDLIMWRTCVPLPPITVYIDCCRGTCVYCSYS